tara:strand:- start:9658 stop:10815 length:1158 start_codon:yes stop_codon:yes gene_type:complete
MKKTIIFFTCILIAIIVWIFPYFQELRQEGLTFKIAYEVFLGRPDHAFDPKDAVKQPDYSQESSWASLPVIKDEADLIPAGEIGVDQLNSEVDVFFIHPTGYLKGHHWTDPLVKESSTKENTKWMMANQASAFNGCCSIYAPHYRQASLYSYYGTDKLREEIHAFVYQDVKKAFKYFIENYSNGRPFIIASHSQGTHHSIRLLAEEIDGTDLYPRMVSAYIIGGEISKSWTNKMNDIYICNSPTELGCLVHWDTINITLINREMPRFKNNICVNPITWKNKGSLSNLSDSKGAVYVSGNFAIDFLGDDEPKGEIFGPLEAPIKQYVQAQCKNGILYASDQTGTRFEGFGGSDGNYHGLDFALFYMDIRENAILRTKTYLDVNANK